MAETPRRGWLGALAARVTSAAPEIRAAVGKLVAPPSDAQALRPLSQQLLYVGVQTPDDVAALMRLADTGYLYRLHDYWEEQRNRDCHLGTVVYRREHGVSTVPWQMIPASERRRDLRIAAWVEECLRRMGEIEHRESARLGLDLKSFSDLTVHLNGGNFPGHAASEIVWSKDGGRVVPAGALPMNGRRFVYGTMDGQLRWYDATGPLHPYPGKDLLRDYPAGRFLLHRPRINGAPGPREGLWRPLLWASLFRTWSVGDWMRLAELAWKPYRWGEYESTAGEKDKTALRDALQQLIAHGYALLPNRTKLHIEYAKGNAQGEGQHAKLAAFLGQEMSKLVLGHTLTVEEGNKGTARTAGTAESVAHDLLEIDARALESTIQRQLIAPLVRANFGDVPLPRFVFVTEESKDIVAIADAVAKLVKDGNLQGISARWMRSLIGAPEPDIGEEVLGGVVWTGPTVAPAAAPAAEPANDVEGPEMPERSLVAALRNYQQDLVLCAAGRRVRRAA